MANINNFQVKEVYSEYDALVKALDFMKKNEVLVGIPQSDTIRKVKDKDSESITNAELLFIHTNGSPINHIPARPVIEPAIEDSREALDKMLVKSLNLAIEGKRSQAIVQLKRTGMKAQNICRAWFTNPKNGWPENSPLVKLAKMRKGSTDPKPLIDTGELRKSITYVVSINGKRQK